MFIGGNNPKGSRYLSFPVYHFRVPWIQKLTSIDQFRYIKIQSQTIDPRTKLSGINPTNSVFISQMSLMEKLVSIDNQNHVALTSQSLVATIGSLKNNWPLFHYVTRISGILPYKRILPYKHVSRSLDIFFRLHSTFARLYNAAAPPGSRLCSAGLVVNN